MTPGEIVFGDGPVPILEGRPVTVVHVQNTGDRPVQVGSHFHFSETNPALRFDRAAIGWPSLRAPASASNRVSPSTSS
jgi:urease subunit beta